MYTKKFWKDAAERATATFAQTVIAIVGVLFPAAAISSGEDLQVGLEVALHSTHLIILAGLGSALLAVLKAVAAAYKSKTDSASLIEK